MAGPNSSSPELTVALAMGAGVVAQALAHHLRIPGIVVLIAAGILLGPDGIGLIHPEVLGDALSALVGFAVAIILFEGGLNLTGERVKRAGSAIRLLISLGALITASGGACAAHFIMGWDWPPSILFGTLVIVTGPTVVTPLLRRLKLEKQVSMLLEAEGVLGDAIGAITAVVALEIAVNAQTGGGFATGALQLPLRLGGGSLAGLVGGLLIAFALRRERLIPEGMQNIFTLGAVVGLFFLCDSVLPESGLAAVTVAGVVVANIRTGLHEELQEFKEQLTVMLIGLLFVLLAADVRVADVVALGIPGVLTAAAMMFLVRPAQVFVSTMGSGMSLRQKAFMSWIAPRGIVAAAVASHFANELSHAGISGGTELRAMVFLVIVMTVVSAGLTGGVIASWLGLRRGDGEGWVILGANELGRLLAHVLNAHGQHVIIVDTNLENCRAASTEGLTAINGNALDERVLLQTGIEARAGVIGILPNEAINLRFADGARKLNKELRAFVALNAVADAVTEAMVQSSGANIMFGRNRDLDGWIVGLRGGTVHLEEWKYTASSPLKAGGEPDSMLGLLIHRDGTWMPMHDAQTFEDGDELLVAVTDGGQRRAAEWLQDHGWVRQDSGTMTKAADAVRPAQPSSEFSLVGAATTPMPDEPV